MVRPFEAGLCCCAKPGLPDVVKRILILAPKAILKQWQVELREKFNLNWPIYDGRKLVWYPSPAWRGRNERDGRPPIGGIVNP